MDLSHWGWEPFFERQLTPDERTAHAPMRVVAVHRNEHVLTDGDGEVRVALGGGWYRRPPQERPTVGDWVLVDAPHGKITRCLDRKSVLQRIAAGDEPSVQLIGANVDTVFIVSSCNEEFNAARLQRYLALVADAAVQAVVVLTKADLITVDAAARYREQAMRVARGVPVWAVNALDRAEITPLEDWLQPGRTLALLGSSGVGKSTLLNTFSGETIQATQDIMADDRGRHTTTHRSLYRLMGGALILDTPGMRELALAELGAKASYEDIEELAQECKFSDCAHDGEPGCAVRAAIDAGSLAEERLRGYAKLAREQRNLAEQRVLAERRASAKRRTLAARHAKKSKRKTRR